MYTTRKIYVFGLITFILLQSGLIQANYQTTLTYFESGTQTFLLDVNQVGSYADVGAYPHWCLGNITSCAGLSVAFWLKPASGDIETPGITIFSNGGHMQNGNGFYIKQVYGNQYEVGVAFNTQVWRSSFSLLADNWIHLGFSWSTVNGLVVRVDGLLQTTVATSESRDPVTSDFNTEYGIEVGLDEYGQPLTSSTRFLISDIVIHDNQSKLTSVTESLGNNDHLYLGCNHNLIVNPTDVTNIAGQTWPIGACRTQCKASKHAFALLLNNVNCSCARISPTVTGTSDCTSSNWAIYTVSHITTGDSSVVLTTTATELSTRGYTKPGESILTDASINFNIAVDYLFDFGDGTVISTDTPPVSYSWTSSGNHTITVTVSIGLVQVSATVVAAVKDVDEGVAPKLVMITGFHDATSSRKATFDVIVADDDDTSCTVNVGDGSKTTAMTFNSFIGLQSLSHTFAKCGQYLVSVACTNSYGSRNESITFLAQEFVIRSKFQQTGMSHRVELNGPDAVLNNLSVLVNGTKISYGHSPAESWITIEGTYFEKAIDNLIEVRYGETVLIRYNIHAERRVPDVRILVDSAAGAWNMSTNLTFEIPPSDHLSIVIDLGVGDEPQLYYIHEANTTLPITSAAEYDGLGNYGISFSVANDITSDHVGQEISVEVPITDISVSTANITSLLVPLHLSVNVNPGSTGPEKVEFVIDYKDGSTPYRETYFNSDANGFTPFEHDYTYGNWGIYVVSVRAYNNISTVTKTALVQVGQNITSVDIVADVERISVGNDVTFTATCPTGSDVTYTVNFGDGTSFSLPESIPGGRKTADQTKGTVVSESIVKITHNYTTKGYFNVNTTVTNVFNSATSPLCPTVIVDEETTTGPPVCSIPTISFPQFAVTTISNPVTHIRSEKMKISADAELQCSVNATANYSWKAMLVTIDGPNITETTVHEICLFQELNETLTIPPLALPYGLYRITVTVAPIGHDLISASKDFYLQIIMSYPVAHIAGDEVEIFFVYAHAIFDLAGSRDPDLKHNVHKDLSFDVFFMPESFLTVSKTKNLSEMKNVSSELVTKTMFRQTTKNRITIYDRGSSFNITEDFIEDVTVYNAKVTFPAKHFVSDYFSFGILVFVTRNDLTSKTFQITEIKASNQTSNDLTSMLDLARNADPDTAIRICDSAAADILNQEAGSVDEQEQLASNTEAVVDTLGSVAKRVDNANQASKCAKAIKIMTSNKDIVTEGSRYSAAGAYVDLANSTSQMEDATVEDAENFAGETLGGFDNIFPTTPEPITAKRGRKKKVDPETEMTTLLPFTSESTTPLPSTSISTTTTTTTTTSATTTTSMSTTTSGMPTTAMTSSSHAPTSVAVVDNREPILIAEEIINELAELETYDDLFYYIFDDCALFRKVMRGPEVQSNVPCVTAEVIDSMRCSGLHTLQDQVFFNMTFFEHPGDIYDFYLTPLIRAREIRDEKKRLTDANVAKSGSEALGTVANTVNAKAPEGDDKERGFQSKRLGLKVQKVNLKAAKDSKNNDTDTAEPKSQKMSLPVGSFSMPVDVLASQGDCGDVSTMFLGDNDNPYGFSKEKSSVGKGVVSLGYSCGGQKLKVQNTEKPIEMWLERNASVYKASKFIKVTKWNTADPPTYNYHPINLTDGNSSLQVILRPGADNEAYDIYVMFDSRPNDTVYDFHDFVPKANLSHLGNITDPLAEEELLFTVTVPVELTEMNGTYWVAVKLKQGTATTSGESTNNTYYLTNLVSGCRFWDDENEKWSSEGCKVGPKTTKYSTQCLCSHLTSFGSDFVVPVNTIDFSNVWAKFGNLSENAAVFSTVLVMLGLYIIGIIWARHMDKKDLLKWGATPLEDNLPTDNYHYQLSVQTGIRKNAGTDSKVSFILSGDDSDTGVRRLDDGKRTHLGRGSILNYVLSVETSLGDLTFLRIWHDNGGKGKTKGWYLDQVQVTNLQTGEKSFFLCDRWLAVEEDDGMVDRICPVAGIEDLVAFKQLFSSSARKKLSNEHLWVSVFSRPTRSNFTRVQRISCCMALLFLTMITNCMFFKGEENTSGKTTAISLGPISITLQSLYVSVIGTFIVFPPSFLIVTFFRRCRPRKNMIMQANQQIPKRSQKHKWKNISSASGMWSSYKLQKSKMQRFREAMSGILSFHKKDKYNDDMVQIEHSKKDDSGKKRKKKPYTFPHWCIYIGWVLCVLSIITPAFFTILYSMEWGTKKSNEWLVAFILSFFQSVVVVQPIKVLAIVAFISCVMKKPELDEEELEEDITNVLKPDEDLVKKKDPVKLSAIMLQRKMANSNYQPPNTEELELARKLRMNEIQMEAVLKEIVIFIFFVMTIFFLSYQQRDPVSYRFAENLKSHFLGGFKKINTMGAYWDWLETKFLPTLYATEYHNGTEIQFWMDRNCITDLQTRRVAVARLRQMRVKDETCTVLKEMRTLIHHCRDEYSWTDDDTKPYYPIWTAPPDKQNATWLKKQKTPWVYQNSLKLANAPYMATVSTYKGGGYVQLLTRQIYRTKKIITRLKQENWLDTRTRAVFLEFTLYNPNVNLFSSCVLVVEFMHSGGAITRYDFKVFRLMSYIGGFGLIVLLMEVVYACFTIYFFVRCIMQVKKHKLKYFKNFWYILEFVLLCFAVSCIVMYIFKHILTELAMHSLQDRESDGFVNFQTVALYDEVYGYVMSAVVFLATIQFLKLLQFNQKMSMLGDTLRIATKDLKVFSVAFLVYFFAFTALAFLLFGQMMVSYNNVIGAAESMFAFALGSFDFEGMTAAQPFLGPIFFFSFIGVIYIGMMSIFLTIIGDAFTQVKQDVTLRKNDYEIVDFVCRRIKGLLGMQQ